MAQRLVRRICPACAQDDAPDPDSLPADFIPTSSSRLRRGSGCRECRGLGYRGRVGVYELLRMSDEIRKMIMHRVNAPEIAAQALRDGDLSTLREDAYEKARAGVTTIAEVVRTLSA